MNRSITNTIRFFMDECLPPLIRDNYYFMYPFFFIWFKGKNINRYMNFKSLVYSMSRKEFEQFYLERDSLATDRPTDLNNQSIEFMLEHLDKNSKTIIDVGCGNGFFLSKVNELNKFEINGCDVLDNVNLKNGKYFKGDIEHLPFRDKEFDIVTAHHTLEHIIDVQKAVAELKRIAGKQLIVVVPCQRYFYYTLDEHVHFFPIKEILENLINIENHICKKIGGDWVYIGNMKSEI